MSMPEINMYDFTKTDFDSDLFALNNSIDTILAGINIEFVLPSTQELHDDPNIGDVYHRQIMTLNKHGDGCLPFFYIVLTEEGNLWRIRCKQSTSASNSISVKKYGRSAFYYITATESAWTEYDNATESLDNELYAKPNTPEGEAGADDCWIYGYVYWRDGYEPPFYIDTNIPIFLVDEDFDADASDCVAFSNHSITAQALMASNEHIIGLLNGGYVKDPIRTIEVVSIGKEATWTYNTYEYTNEPSRYHGYRVTYDLNDCNVSQYVIPGITQDGTDDILKVGINITGDPIKLEYTTNGVNWIEPPAAHYQLPFDYVYRYRDKENGTFFSALSNYSNGDAVLTFGTKGASDAYNRGDSDGSDAVDFGSESGKIPPKNPTEDPDPGNNWGQVYTRAFFSQQYIVDVTTLQEICNGLYDVSPNGVWEDIKKGLDMYGQNPMDAVGGLMFYPVDLSTIYATTSSPETSIWFGGYQFNLSQGGVCRKITYPNGYMDFGTFSIQPTYKNFRDYEPYQRLKVYLPYIGWNYLDLKKYMGKTVSVRYFFDTRTGMCLATLSAGVVLDSFSGQCGVSMPITLTDFSRYAQTQIQTLLGGGADTINNIGNAASTTTGMIAGGMAAGASLAMGAAGAGVGLALAGGKTAFALTQNHIANYSQTKGSSSSMLNQYMPQEVMFEFEIIDAMPTQYEQSLIGYPSNESGIIGSFAGYLEIDTVELNCSGITEGEREMIISLLQSGIYI